MKIVSFSGNSYEMDFEEFPKYYFALKIWCKMNCFRTYPCDILGDIEELKVLKRRFDELELKIGYEAELLTSEYDNNYVFLRVQKIQFV